MEIKSFFYYVKAEIMSSRYMLIWNFLHLEKKNLFRFLFFGWDIKIPDRNILGKIYVVICSYWQDSFKD